MQFILNLAVKAVLHRIAFLLLYLYYSFVAFLYIVLYAIIVLF